jgi:hypothetical protein
MPKRPAGEWSPSIPFTSSAFQPYAIALGRLALAWNDLHLSLQMLLFCTVMGGGFINPALSIWNALKVDRSQRDILKAAANAQTLNGGSKELAEEIKWICDRTDRIEDLRNDALHSPLWGIVVSTEKPSIQPVSGLGHVRAGKLQGKDLLVEFNRCRATATALRDYATKLDFAVCRNRSFPGRPVLPVRTRPNAKKPRYGER